MQTENTAPTITLLHVSWRGVKITGVNKERSGDGGMQSTASDTVLPTNTLQPEYCPTWPILIAAHSRRNSPYCSSSWCL